MMTPKVKALNGFHPNFNNSLNRVVSPIHRNVNTKVHVRKSLIGAISFGFKIVEKSDDEKPLATKLIMIHAAKKPMTNLGNLNHTSLMALDDFIPPSLSDETSQ